MDLGSSSIISIFVGIAILWLVCKWVLVPIKNLLVNVLFGLIAIYIINIICAAMQYPEVPINWITGTIIGIFGFPGTILVSVYYIFFS